MRTHVLIFGSTGSGKTVMMVSMAYNALVQASGLFMWMVKVIILMPIFSMVRSMRRDDDLLLNFMTGARILWGHKKRISNHQSVLSRLIQYAGKLGHW